MSDFKAMYPLRARVLELATKKDGSTALAWVTWVYERPGAERRAAKIDWLLEAR